MKKKRIVLNGESVTIDEALEAWMKRYNEVYPVRVDLGKEVLDTPLTEAKVPQSKVVVEKPVVVIPIFPGQNCEYDTTQKFERAGARFIKSSSIILR